MVDRNQIVQPEYRLQKADADERQQYALLPRL